MISRIRSTLFLHQQNMGFFLCRWTMFDSFRHDKELTRIQNDVAASQLKPKFSFQHQEEIVGVVMLMPDKITFHFHDDHFVAIEITDHVGLPET